jgi:hypothetical protein
MGRSWSHNRSRIIFLCLNCMSMMQLWFWLRLRPLSFGIYSEKIISWYKMLDFFHYIGQKDRCLSWIQSHSSSRSWSRIMLMLLRFWLWLRLLSFGLYSDKIKILCQIVDFFHCLGKSIEFWSGARTGAALCWCCSGMKKWYRSGSGFDYYPLV